MASRELIESGLPVIAKIDFLTSKIIAGTPESYSFIVTTVAADTVTIIELFNSETTTSNAPKTLTDDINTLVDGALLTAYNTIKAGLTTLLSDAEYKLAELEEPV